MKPAIFETSPNLSSNVDELVIRRFLTTSLKLFVVVIEKQQQQEITNPLWV